MKPYYEHGGITIYHGDCREILPSLEQVDAVVTDPPYGIGWVPRVNHTGADHVWIDDKQFDPRPFLSIGKQHLFWGGNYFAHLLPPTESWFCWMKRPVGSDVNFEKDRRSYAMAELAWSDFGTKPLVKVHVWDGGMREGRTENRAFCHPSQKPVEVMRWCLVETEGTVLDPFCGSGTTLVAAKDLGLRAIGIEIEERYCEIAAKRLAQEVLPFTSRP
jgi:DNA modification methylase